MIVPNNIKQAIKEYVEAENKAILNERKIMRWLEKNRLTENTCWNIDRAMDYVFEDYCRISRNPESFIAELENLDDENSEYKVEEG